MQYNDDIYAIYMLNMYTGIYASYTLNVYADVCMTYVLNWAMVCGRGYN